MKVKDNWHKLKKSWHNAFINKFLMMTGFSSIKISQLFSALLTTCYILEKSELSHQKNLLVPSEREILQLFYTRNNG